MQNNQQQVNGNVPLVNGLPSAGQQTDMTHLWTIVQQLSDALAENRAQTAGIIAGVQGIQNRAAEEGNGRVPTAGQVNGELQANLAQRNTILETENLSLRNSNSRLESEILTLGNLMTDYEDSLKTLLDKVRPYAYNHQQAILSLHAHYNALLDQERQEKLDQSLEHARWQAGLGKVAEYAREALRSQNEESLPYRRKIKELRAENRILRRLAGWEEGSDSSDDEEEMQAQAQGQQMGHEQQQMQ